MAWFGKKQEPKKTVDDYFEFGILASELIVANGITKQGLDKEVVAEIKSDYMQRLRDIITEMTKQELETTGAIARPTAVAREAKSRLKY